MNLFQFISHSPFFPFFLFYLFIFYRGDINYRIIDTAGIRKKGKVEYGAEFFMINRAFKAVKRAEVVVLLLDALDGIVEQDRILAQRIAEVCTCTSGGCSDMSYTCQHKCVCLCELCESLCTT